MATRKAKPGRATRTSGGSNWFSELSDTKKDLVSIACLYIILLVLFRGIVFNNGAFSAEADTAAALAYAHAGDQIKEAEGVDPLWMPYFFSGMPTFGNVAYVPHDVSYVQKMMVAILKLLFLNATWSWILVHYFLGGVFMFLLMRFWKFSHIPALFAALTFMLSPFAIGLAQEGHGSKLMALMYMPAVFLLTDMLFRRRDALSFGLFAAGIGTLLLTNHMQIVYYILMVVGLYFVYTAVSDAAKDTLLVAKRTALFVGGLLIGFCISSYIYLSVYEYAQYSIRGSGTAGTPGGLTWDYATNWSFHPGEMFTYLIPSFFGFSSANPVLWQGQIQRLPLYWGTMPFNTSTVYVGLLPVILSITAVVYRRNRITIFFAILAIFLLLASFGKHFGFFYELMFNVLPFFDKFRAPSMILQLMAFTTAVLGGYGLAAILEGREGAINMQKLSKTLLYILGVLWIVLILGSLFRSSLYEMLSGSMFAKADENYNPQVLAELKKLRFDVLWGDYLKMVVIATAGLGAVILFLGNKIKSGMFGTLILAVLVIDLSIIDTKFINPQPLNAAQEQFQADATVTFLKQQPGLFRVFPLGELFMEKSYAYHGLQSVGGYHPAKLKIYQTMLDSCMYRGVDPNFPVNMNIVNMLSAQYVVAKGQLPPDRFELVNADQAKRTFTFRNSSALPRAWFVSNALVAHSGTEVFAQMNDPGFNPARTAILEEEPAGTLTAPDSSAAEVTEYKSNKITVNTYTSSSALLVLSEIYYPAGWNVYVDGTMATIHKTNYVLRSVVVPAGEHTVEFRFEPAMYALGWNLTTGAWVICGLCILIGLFADPGIRGRVLGRRGSGEVVAAKSGN